MLSVSFGISSAIGRRFYRIDRETSDVERDTHNLNSNCVVPKNDRWERTSEKKSNRCPIGEEFTRSKIELDEKVARCQWNKVGLVIFDFELMIIAEYSQFVRIN